MGTINKGILGGFRGKVGNVVGFFYKGKAVMRSLAGSIANPRTDAQQTVRQKFILLGVITRALAAYISGGFRLYANSRGLTAPNIFMRRNFNDAIEGDYPDQRINWMNLSLSEAYTANTGEYAPAGVDGATVATAAGTVTASWVDNTAAFPGTLGSDIVDILVYVPTLQQGVTTGDTATRAATTATINVPTGWVGEIAHVYAYTRAADGTAVGTTTYFGQVTIE